MTEPNELDAALATLREAIARVRSVDAFAAPLASALAVFEARGSEEAASLTSYIIDAILPGRAFGEYLAAFELDQLATSGVRGAREHITTVEESEIETIEAVHDLVDRGLATMEPNRGKPWDGPLVRISPAGEAELEAIQRSHAGDES